MGVIERLERKLKALKVSINWSIRDSINANKDVLIDLQTNDQLYNGEDADGQQLFPSYAFSTYQIKNRKGQKVSNVTLKDTGDLYEDIAITASNTEMVISSKTEYFEYLVNHYKNNQILGIQDINLKAFLEKYTLPVIEKNFKAIIKA